MMPVLVAKSATKSPIVQAEDIPKMFSNVEHILKVRRRSICHSAPSSRLYIACR